MGATVVPGHAQAHSRPVSREVPLSVPQQPVHPAAVAAETNDKPKPVPREIPTTIDPATQEVVAVAVGLGPQAPGSRPERATVDQLEASVGASQSPKTSVRRLRAGSGNARQICRDYQDDLVIMLDYLPDRPRPVLVAHDCRLDRPLAIRGDEAAGETGLVAALWDEHRQLVRDGVKERRAAKLNPKVRAGLLAGGAIVVIGAAVAVLVANGLRKDTVVLTVGP